MTLFYVIIISTLGGLFWFYIRGFAYVILFPSSFESFGFYYKTYLEMMNLISHVTFLTSPLFGWSLMYFGLKYYFNLQEEREKSHNLVLLAQQAQLQMLRYQINPHFLFNTLNSIKALIRRESALAETMITELSEFLRYTLRHNDKTIISLEEEIEIVKKYLLLEKIRYEKRLNYSFDIDEKSLKVNVLCFLLQPFVENAIKHGLTGSPKGITIIIRSFIADSNLYIQVKNSGKWIDNSNTGNGIKNVHARLEAAYPNKYEFNINKESDEISVTIAIKDVL